MKLSQFLSRSHNFSTDGRNIQHRVTKNADGLNNLRYLTFCQEHINPFQTIYYIRITDFLGLFSFVNMQYFLSLNQSFSQFKRVLSVQLLQNHCTKCCYLFRYLKQIVCIFILYTCTGLFSPRVIFTLLRLQTV